MKKLVNSVDIDKLVKIDFPKFNRDSNIFYQIIDVKKYVNNLREDYNRAIKTIKEQRKMDFFKDFTNNVDSMTQAPKLTKDDLKQYHTVTEWYDLPNADVVLKQLENINTKYALIVFDVNMDCSNIIMLPLTKESLALMINNQIKPSDKGNYWYNELYLEENDINYLKNVQKLTNHGIKQWIDVSCAYPKPNDISVIKGNLPENL